MAVYLITGGAGFIGSHLAETLVKRKHEVRIIDNFVTGKKSNIKHLEGKVKLWRKSILNRKALAEAVKGADYVLHQAAIPSVPRSVAEPIETNRATVDGTLAVLQEACRAGVKRVVYAASSSAYGDSVKLPKVETMPTAPKSPYAVAKLTAEHYMRIWPALYGLETVCLRYFNIFGPRQDPLSFYAAVIPKFITRALEGKPPVIYGDGKQSRDFTYVENAVAANLAACRAKGASGGLFNVGCGQRHALNKILKLLEKIMGRKIKAQYDPMRTGDVLHSLADISAAKKILGYKVVTTLEEGLEKTVAYFKALKK